MKGKRLVSFLLSGLMAFSLLLATFDFKPDTSITANAEEFSYTNGDIFVADALLNKVILPEGERFYNANPMLAYDVSTREWTFEEIAEDLIDKDWLAGLDIFWINMEKAISFDFVGDESIFTWQQAIYETLIMDYLTYYYESDEFESNLEEDTLDFLSDLMGEFEDSDLFKETKKPDNTPTKGKPALNVVSLDKAAKETKDNSAKVKDCDLLNEKLDQLDTLKEIVDTTAEYFETLAKLMALHKADEGRIHFLQQVKEVSDDENLDLAIDDIMEKYHTSMQELSLTELQSIGLEKLNEKVWDKIVESSEIPVLSEIQLGVSGFDLLFNNNGIAESRMQLTILYIINYHVKETYRNLRDAYIDTPTEKNAADFVNAYQQYTTFVAYASNITKNYLGQRFVEGYSNQLSNYIMPDNDNQVTYDGFSSAMDSCISSCKSLNGMSNQAYKMYNILSGNFEHVGDIATDASDFVYTELDDGTIEITGYYRGDTDVITIPKEIDGKTVTSIGEKAFYMCRNLISIIIPDSVTNIGKSAFEDCDNLTSINIPNGVTNIEDNAFYWCYNLTSITIPDSVTSIGEEAFSCCISLTSITIPNSVTTIGERAFEDCDNLTSVTIPNSVKSIGANAFYDCDNLISVTISDGLTDIGDGAFLSCFNLTSITIPNSVTNIGELAFANCDKLTSVTIPDNVTTIKNMTFYECNSLASITIPNTVTSIERQAFDSCNNLTSITIPDSVKSIEHSVFEQCDNLMSIVIKNPECEIHYPYGTISDLAVIYGYANSTAQAYAEEWGIKFVAIEDMANAEKGDVLGDGSADVTDLVFMQKYLLGSQSLFLNEQYDIADLNSDGIVNVFDLLALKRKLIDQ